MAQSSPGIAAAPSEPTAPAVLLPTTVPQDDRYSDLIGQAVGLRLDSVSREFGGDEDMRVTALRDVSIEIGPGEFVSVVGPSGVLLVSTEP